MPFRQIHRLTSAKLMIFIGYQIIIPLFFSFYQKNSENRLLLAPFLLAPQHCLPPPCPRSSLPPALPASSLPPFPEVFFRAPAEGSLPRPPSLTPVLTVHNPQPPFCLHFSCPYVSLSICAFWLSHFYSFTPSSLLSCPPIQYAYSCVLLFSPSFLSRLLMFMPLISRRQVTSQLQMKAITVHLSIMSWSLWSLQFFRSFRSHLPPRCCRGERGVESVFLLYREDSCGAYKQEHSCYNHHHRLV